MEPIKSTPPPKFFNEQFATDLAKDVYIPTDYGYEITSENDGQVEYWELNIFTTTMAEIDGVAEGEIARYAYTSEENAKEDINTANDFFNVSFEDYYN